MLKRDNKCNQTTTTIPESENYQCSPQGDPLNDNSSSAYLHNDSSIISRRKIFKRTRDDSGSNSRERRMKTQSATMQFITLKKLEEIIKTEADKNDLADASQLSIQSTCSKEQQKTIIENVGSRSPIPPNKFVRTQLTVKVQPQLADKKVVDCRVRPGTPRKEVSFNETIEERRIKQLEQTVKDLQQKLQEKYSLQYQLETVQQKYKTELERIPKLLDRINDLSKEKDQAAEEVQYLKMQVNASRKVTIISTRSDSCESVIKERQNRQLVNDIAKLRDENAKIKEDLAKARNQNTRLIRLNKSYQERIAQFQKNKQVRQQQLAKIQSQRQKSLQQTIQNLKRSLQSTSHQNLQQIQLQLHKTTTDLNYYKVNSHCLKKQLQDTKNQLNKCVSTTKHNELRDQYKKLLAKCRQANRQQQRGRAPARQSRDDTFQLTPEK